MNWSGVNSLHFEPLNEDVLVIEGDVALYIIDASFSAALIDRVIIMSHVSYDSSLV